MGAANSVGWSVEKVLPCVPPRSLAAWIENTHAHFSLESPDRYIYPRALSGGGIQTERYSSGEGALTGRGSHPETIRATLQHGARTLQVNLLEIEDLHSLLRQRLQERQQRGILDANLAACITGGDVADDQRDGAVGKQHGHRDVDHVSRWSDGFLRLERSAPKIRYA